MTWDAIIIGAGLSGLAAGVRLAHFGKSVCILESHTVPGGLNSYYARQGRMLDVGLHAMTNMVPEGTRGAALTKLLRQLRIRYDELGLVPQTSSRVTFPGAALRFSNDPELMRSEVARAFPGQIDRFDRLVKELNGYDEAATAIQGGSARRYLEEKITEPLLRDMLLCPIMYYGNAAEDDMALFSFVIMWKSVYSTGFGRPVPGMHRVIKLLTERFAAGGGTLRFGARVEALETNGDAVRGVRLSSGEVLEAKQVFSSAGLVETLRLGDENAGTDDTVAPRTGALSYAEWIAYLDKPLKSAGYTDSILFFSKEPVFRYRRAASLIDGASGVVCVPDNFDTDKLEPCVRVTTRASYSAWQAARDEGHYRNEKENAAAQLRQLAQDYTGRFPGNVILEDLFTPLTIERYTGKCGGAIYGSPDKRLDGRTRWDNLFLIGTDQGYLGIVGAMLSGISIANRYGLEGAPA